LKSTHREDSEFLLEFERLCPKSGFWVLMAITLHVLLRRDGFRWQWTLSWVVLIVINMSLYLSSVL
jgi:hypothetical protein